MVDLPPPPANAPRRYSASQLPPDADPAEKEFVGLLAKALAPSYMLIRRLGAGGMGTVYVARDPVLKRLVAVKVMSPELSRDPDARSRFSREAQAVAAISHPNVVAVYAVGELENGLPYIVMQYVEGRSMAERIHEDGQLDVPAAKRVLGEVASALAATHKKGIIHRDIKPANILWDDETGRALVTDFGIAAVREHPDERGRDATKITQTGMSVGTPAYMSPEQFLNEPITDKTDIYGLGLLGYELLTGDGPYSVRSPAELMVAHMRDEPRRLSTLRADVDAEIEGLMVRCLDKDPLKRPTAQYIAEHLTRGISALLEWPPPGLERLANQFSSALLQFTFGSLVICVPLVVMSTLDLGDTLREAMPSSGALVVLTLLGFMTLAGGGLNLLDLLRDGIRAVRRGYRWLTVAEVACDSRGDAGALIAGGREYAALSPTQRNALRTRRLIGGGVRLGAAIAPLAGYIVGLVLGTRFGAGPAWVAYPSLVLCMVLLLLSRVLVWTEDWTLRKSRARLAATRTARAADVDSATAWSLSLTAVSAGQRIGAVQAKAEVHSAYWRIALAGFAIVLIVGASVVSYSVAAVGSISGALFNNLGGNNSAVTISRVQRVDRLRRLRLPVDSSVTPLEAGSLLLNLKAERKEPLWASARMASYHRDVKRLPKAIHDTLVMYAMDPGLTGFRRLARAAEYDYLGAAVPLEKLDSMNMQLMPLPKFTPLRSLAAANIFAGMVAAGDGKTALAEQRYLEVLSVGFLMVRSGNTLIESLVGMTLVGRAQEALSVLYEQTGRAVDASFVSTSADPDEGLVAGATRAVDQRQARSVALRMLSNTSMFRGMRMEVLHFPLAYGPCGDLKQVLFGVDPDFTAALAKARKQLVRFPSDSVAFDKFTHALNRPMLDGFGDGGWAYNVANVVAHAVDFLTGSKRMRSCVSMLS